MCRTFYAIYVIFELFFTKNSFPRLTFAYIFFRACVRVLSIYLHYTFLSTLFMHYFFIRHMLLLSSGDTLFANYVLRRRYIDSKPFHH